MPILIKGGYVHMYTSILHKADGCIDIDSEIIKFRAKLTAKRLADMGINQENIKLLLNKDKYINQFTK